MRTTHGIDTRLLSVLYRYVVMTHFFGFRFIALRCVPILRVAPFGGQRWGGVDVVVIGVSLPFGLGLVLT